VQVGGLAGGQGGYRTVLNGKCFHGVGDRLFPTYGNTSDKTVLLKGHGNEPVFLMFLHKPVRHGDLTLLFEPFRLINCDSKLLPWPIFCQIVPLKAWLSCLKF
jgi:hypothetical protein